MTTATANRLNALKCQLFLILSFEVHNLPVCHFTPSKAINPQRQGVICEKEKNLAKKTKEHELKQKQFTLDLNFSR